MGEKCSDRMAHQDLEVGIGVRLTSYAQKTIKNLSLCRRVKWTQKLIRNYTQDLH